MHPDRPRPFGPNGHRPDEPPVRRPLEHAVPHTLGVAGDRGPSIRREPDHGHDGLCPTDDSGSIRGFLALLQVAKLLVGEAYDDRLALYTGGHFLEEPVVKTGLLRGVLFSSNPTDHRFGGNALVPFGDRGRAGRVQPDCRTDRCDRDKNENPRKTIHHVLPSPLFSEKTVRKR